MTAGILRQLGVHNVLKLHLEYQRVLVRVSVRDLQLAVVGVVNVVEGAIWNLNFYFLR